MNINKDQLFKAVDLWASFTEELLYKNRFIVKHEVIDYIKKFAEENKKTIEEGKVIYRARIYYGHKYNQLLGIGIKDQELDLYASESMKNKKLGFWGYNKNDSFVPPDNDLIVDGRVNPAFIKCLYTAEDPYTAMVEVRPYLMSKVSIAEIKVNQQLNIADFSYETTKKYDEFDKYILVMIIQSFSEPTNSNKKDYIVSQYISEYIKSLGFEGISFNSSLHESGKNIAIFNYSKCEAIGSKLYQISDICFESNGILPEGLSPLMHKKLEKHRNNKLRPL